jgi:hypothetical protein
MPWLMYFDPNPSTAMAGIQRQVEAHLAKVPAGINPSIQPGR